MNFKYDLRHISNKNQLLKFLSIEEEAFDRLTQFTLHQDDHDHPSGAIIPINIPVFLRHDIPKKNAAKGFRTVWEVPSPENEFYKAFSRRLDNFFRHAHPEYPHKSAYGYVKDRNINENATLHCGNRNLLIFDIKDFFQSIDRKRIFELFKSTDVNDAVSLLLSDLLTIDGRLPLGLSPSPIVANAICLQLDRDFYDLSVSIGATYSRYADDITFSSNSILPTTESITAILETHSFEVAVEKTRRSRIGQRHYVTGLSVSDINQPHIPKPKKRRLRQELYFAKKFGLDGHFRHLGLANDDTVQREVNRLDGMVKFTTFHEPRLANPIKKQWAKVLEDSGHRPSFEPKNQHRKPFDMYFDESEYQRDGIKYLALGVSVSQYQHKIDNDVKEILNYYLSDQWAAGKRDAIVRNGIHFTDATEDLKLKFVEKLQILPFQGYVAFSQYSEANDYEQAYLNLLRAMITRRLMAAESCFSSLHFEKTYKVNKSRIRGVVAAAYGELAAHNNRRPESYEVCFIDKSTEGVSVPDFLLGVLGKYLKSNSDVSGKPQERDQKMFERLRDKYRLILNLDTQTEFSRRTPLSPW